MNTFLWLYLVLCALAALSRSAIICISTYPRTLKRSILDDVLGLLGSIGFGIWAGVLLFGGAK